MKQIIQGRHSGQMPENSIGTIAGVSKSTKVRPQPHQRLTPHPRHLSFSTQNYDGRRQHLSPN